MDGKTIYLETGSLDPFYNLAFEEYVLRNWKEGNLLILWQNANTIVIGQNQNAEAEINRSFVEANKINVVRRGSGGGAVYHDLGNLNYSFITNTGDSERLTMEIFTRPIVEALKGLGLNAEASGRNDILVDGKKISGTAQRMVGGRILHHGTLLFDSDPEMIAGALRVDPSKFQSKSSKSVRSRIGTIRSALEQDMDLPTFWSYLKEALAPGGLVKTTLTSEELAEIQTLRDTKYATWEWNFGRSPKFELSDKRRFPGGTLEVSLRVVSGHITNITFLGDFLSLASLEDLEQALQGCPFRREDVSAVLARFPLETLFGTITEQEVLDTVFFAGDLAET